MITEVNLEREQAEYLERVRKFAELNPELPYPIDEVFDKDK